MCQPRCCSKRIEGVMIPISFVLHIWPILLSLKKHCYVFFATTRSWIPGPSTWIDRKMMFQDLRKIMKSSNLHWFSLISLISIDFHCFWRGTLVKHFFHVRTRLLRVLSSRTGSGFLERLQLFFPAFFSHLDPANRPSSGSTEWDSLLTLSLRSN